ncbi:uncharacterized protein METZ01_LOCUS120891 [marine metagenome]|jgi:hypothetical protein|uniref:Uncharacterized protein n=1 Tax=marine metagenome TaxID=408172 RepID=A0A381XV14_9ZZZZ|tara:strand:+ start:1801 stop:2367 length:567 start_codon:yes stop_codon:yes gene_type:complete
MVLQFRILQIFSQSGIRLSVQRTDVSAYVNGNPIGFTVIDRGFEPFTWSQNSLLDVLSWKILLFKLSDKEFSIRTAFKYKMSDLVRFERLQLDFFFRTKLYFYVIVIRIENVDLPDPDFRDKGNLVRHVVFAKVFQEYLHSGGTECHVLHSDVLNMLRILYFYQMYLGNFTTIQPGSSRGEWWAPSNF